MADSGDAGSAPRRSTLAGSLSLALHGGALVVALALAGGRVARSPRQLALTSIEVVDPSPVPASPQPAHAAPVARAATSDATAVAHGRRGAVPRAPSRAAVAVDPLANLKVSYEDPTSFGASHPADATPGLALGAGSGIGTSKPDADSLAILQLPIPSPGSVAQAPRPRRNYHELRLRAVRQFAGQTIKVTLAIDPEGRVSAVRLLRGVDARLDQRTIELARTFEFEAARDETGAPISGSSTWEFLIVDDDGAGLRRAIDRGHY